MPCLNISTNVNLDGVDTSAILSDATSSVADLIGKPKAVLSFSLLLLSFLAILIISEFWVLCFCYPISGFVWYLNCGEITASIFDFFWVLGTGKDVGF